MKKHILIAALLAFYFLVLNPVPSVVMVTMNSKTQAYHLGDNLSVILPPTTQIKEDDYDDKTEVLLSHYFHDEKYLIRGYIQLWQINDLEQFLVASRANSSYDFQAYSLSKTSVYRLSGYIDQWTASFGDRLSISGKEYWLKKQADTQVLRISFFTDATSFSEVQLQGINQILSTIHWK
ncbi:hypothetical protein LPY66_11805 [Dehalobacter sp. DCM]|uniref:hypothetical protein n=1 Tax=Dehalobacter sp. DCM TaxID=2907827 RepID=UPI0030814A94|nr:hypothetical protein LPY66_11805 [Dehalobacter sp. DCM]